MKKFLILLALSAASLVGRAQRGDTVQQRSSADSLMNSLSTAAEGRQAVLPAFKATRLIFSPTTELVQKKNLNFLVIHRFGDIGTPIGGAQTFFGLDAINDVYIGFEYGISDALNINLGRNTIGQLIELQFKYRLLQQSAAGGAPVSLALQAGGGLRPYGSFSQFSDRLSYLAEAILSRRINPTLSVEVLPVFVRNEQPIPFVSGNGPSFFSVAAAARIKISRHSSFLLDYEHPFSAYRSTGRNFEDPLGLGAEFETGGHVFTLNITNARAISQISSLSDSQASYGRGQFRFGFTISRMFDFNRNRKKTW